MIDHDAALALLDEYVDGALAPAERAALEAHLAACPACRAELTALRALLAEAAALPEAIEPPRDLWAGIVAQVQPRRSWYLQPRVLALAAVLLVGTTAAVTHLLEPAPAPLVAQAPVPWETELMQASAALSQALDARRADLDPDTVAILDQNLHIIDQAIEDCRIALETDPSNPHLEQSLRETLQRRVRLLDHARRLPSDS